MYRIKYLLDKKIYQIHSSKQGAFEGNLTDITYKALEMGLSNQELTLAFNTMSKEKHIVAEFGINGRFMYSHMAQKAA